MFRDEIQSLTAADMFRSNIVVADDEAVNRLLIGKYLSSAGFTNVHMAENGAEALELIEQVNADVLVLDIVMPVMDGFEVLETLRSENSKWQSLPILVETALDAPEERNQVFEAGATDLVTKPLNGKELVSRVKIHLENRMLMGQLQDFHERISADLARAQTMQLGLLPSETDIETITADHGIHIASAFHPCEELGGGYLDADPAVGIASVRRHGGLVRPWHHRGPEFVPRPYRASRTGPQCHRSRAGARRTEQAAQHRAADGPVRRGVLLHLGQG